MPYALCQFFGLERTGKKSASHIALHGICLLLPRTEGSSIYQQFYEMSSAFYKNQILHEKKREGRELSGNQIIMLVAIAVLPGIAIPAAKKVFGPGGFIAYLIYLFLFVLPFFLWLTLGTDFLK